MAILPENEFYTFEDRQYIQPQVSLDEQNKFIDNLRNVQAQNNQQISSQTYNLGSAIPSNLGGLLGGGGYWKSRYQTPQTNVLVNDLRTAAQSKALTDVLANEQAKMQKRYNAAYRSSQIRGSNSGGSNSDILNEILKKLGIDVNSGGNNGEGTVSEDTSNNKTGFIVTKDGSQAFVDKNGKQWSLSNPDSGFDTVILNRYIQQGGNLINAFPDGTKLENGAVYETNGRRYIYRQDSKYPQGAFFRMEGE